MDIFSFITGMMTARQHCCNKDLMQNVWGGGPNESISVCVILHYTHSVFVDKCSPNHTILRTISLRLFGLTHTVNLLQHILSQLRTSRRRALARIPRMVSELQF